MYDVSETFPYPVVNIETLNECLIEKFFGLINPSIRLLELLLNIEGLLSSFPLNCENELFENINNVNNITIIFFICQILLIQNTFFTVKMSMINTVRLVLRQY